MLSSRLIGRVPPRLSAGPSDCIAPTTLLKQLAWTSALGPCGADQAIGLDNGFGACGAVQAMGLDKWGGGEVVVGQRFE